MNTKLTLRLDEHLITFAKEYAAQSGKPVSKIVADFFILIKNEKITENDSLTPKVSALKGILSEAVLPETAHKKHWQAKHL